MAGFYAILAKFTKVDFLQNILAGDHHIGWFDLSWFLSDPLLKLVWSPKWESSYQVEEKWETKMEDFQNFKFQFPLPWDSNSDSPRWSNDTGTRMRRIMSKGAQVLKVAHCNFNTVTNYCFGEPILLLTTLFDWWWVGLPTSKSSPMSLRFKPIYQNYLSFKLLNTCMHNTRCRRSTWIQERPLESG